MLLGVLTACGSDPALLADRAVEIAVSYFQENYARAVHFESVGRYQVGEREFLNCITVSDGERNYRLLLDGQDHPIADDYMCILKIAELEEREDNFHSGPYGSPRFYAVFSPAEQTYHVVLAVSAQEVPRAEDGREIWESLARLRESRVDELVLEVESPAFLHPVSEFGSVEHGLQLAAMTVETSATWEVFEGQYRAFTDSIFWDEQEFEQATKDLADVGYEDVYFYLSGLTGNTLELTLHVEGDREPTDKLPHALLDEVDDDWLRCEGREIVCVLEFETEER